MLIGLIESLFLGSMVQECKPLMASMISSVFVLNMMLSSLNLDLNIELLFKNSHQSARTLILVICMRIHKISHMSLVYFFKAFFRDIVF